MACFHLPSAYIINPKARIFEQLIAQKDTNSKNYIINVNIIKEIANFIKVSLIFGNLQLFDGINNDDLIFLDLLDQLCTS